MNRQYCPQFSVNIVLSLPFSSRWKAKKGYMKCYYYIFSIKESLKTVICKLSCRLVSHTCLLEYDGKESATSGSKSLFCQQTPHLPECVASVLAQEIVKYEEIQWNLHWLWHMGIAEGSGLQLLHSFISMHSFMTSNTSLMKWVSAPDSESGAGGHDCSTAPNSELGTGWNGLNDCWWTPTPPPSSPQRPLSFRGFSK